MLLNHALGSTTISLKPTRGYLIRLCSWGCICNYIPQSFPAVVAYSCPNIDACLHYTGVIMSAMVSQITSLTIVCSTVYTGTDQRKHQSSAGLCVGNSPVTGEFPAQMASNAENVSIWWRHHELISVSKSHLVTYTCIGDLVNHCLSTESIFCRCSTAISTIFRTKSDLTMGLLEANFR